MKKLILLLLVLTFFGQLYSQSLYSYPGYTKTDAIISASILGATFISAESFGQNMSKNQIATLNFSGIAISAGYSLIVTTKPYKKISYKVKRWIKLQRNKSINEILICKK